MADGSFLMSTPKISNLNFIIYIIIILKYNYLLHPVTPSPNKLPSAICTINLSPHFTLGELTKTSYKTEDQNIPSRVAIENLKNLCENWLEDLRYSYNTLYPRVCPQEEIPLVINSGYRSPEVNKRAGGSSTSNHLTGCAVDIRVSGFEQAIRYASILLDISDGTKRDFDELYIERNKTGSHWIHFAVRPKGNRRKIDFIKV